MLASDVSRSIDHPKFLLQREGYAAAVANPQVLDAIKSGPHGKIALASSSGRATARRSW